MPYKILKDSIRRHLDETRPLIEQLLDVDVMSKPIAGGREIGEVVLHMLRSLEYYMKGVVTNQWEPLPYFLETYDSAESIIQLAKDVFDRVKMYTNLLSSRSIALQRLRRLFSRCLSIVYIIVGRLQYITDYWV